MDFKVESLAPCRKRIAVTIPSERVKAEYDKQYGEINKQVAMPGFRRGHTPRKLLERRFGSKLGDEVKDALVRAALEALMQEKQVEPLSPPSIDLAGLAVDPARALTFEFELLTRPEFATPTWKGLEMKVAPVVVSDEEVQHGVEGLLRRGAQLVTAEGAVIGEGDVLVLDWKAEADGATLAQDDGAYHQFGRGAIGGLPCPEIEAQLRGQRVGASASGPVKAAADDPREALRGKDLVLSLVVKEVKRFQLPAIDAAFLAKHDYDDEAEMRTDVRRQIQRGKTRERDEKAEEGLLERVVASVALTLPDEILAQELDGWTQRKRAELAEAGTPAAEVEPQVAAGRPAARVAIEAELKRYFVLDRIAREESLVVGEQELAQALQEIAAGYGRPIDEVVQAFRQGGRLDELRGRIRHRKVREAVRRAAQLIETSA